jgi:hypothetical protein
VAQTDDDVASTDGCCDAVTVIIAAAVSVSVVIVMVLGRSGNDRKKRNAVSKMTITWSGRRIECELKYHTTYLYACI